MAVGSVRTHPLHQLTKQLLSRLFIATRAIESELPHALEVTSHRLSINAQDLGNCSFSGAL